MCLKPVYLRDRDIYVPCRHCVECKMQYSTDWAHRVMLEAKKHEHNTFLTLTYNDEHLPPNSSLRKSDLQKFFKRFRKHLKGAKIRYFACGEYGAKHERPHYHIVIFGYDFPDRIFFRFDRKKTPLFRSPTLEKLWSFGFSSIAEELTFEVAKYVAKYMQADMTFKKVGPWLATHEPPFTVMSRRPGIALDCIPSSVYDHGAMYVDGKRVLPPVAFQRKAKAMPVCNSDGELIDYYNKYRPELSEEAQQDKFIRLEERRKKYKKIFGNSIDKDYCPVVSFKRSKKVNDEVNRF